METIQKLLLIPETERTVSWGNDFYAAVLDTTFVRGDDFIGPDSFPYAAFKFELGESEKKKYLVKDVLEELLEAGKGLVIFNEEGQMIWVFSYGKLWSLKQFGSFNARDPEEDEMQSTDTFNTKPSNLTNKEVSIEERTVNESREVLIGQPDPSYFPLWARKVVGTYLEQRGVTDPKMFLMMDVAMKPSRSLVFSVYPEDFKEEKDFHIFMEKLNWFFPTAYSLVTMPKEQAQSYQENFQLVLEK